MIFVFLQFHICCMLETSSLLHCFQRFSCCVHGAADSSACLKTASDSNSLSSSKHTKKHDQSQWESEANSLFIDLEKVTTVFSIVSVHNVYCREILSTGGWCNVKLSKWAVNRGVISRVQCSIQLYRPLLSSHRVDSWFLRGPYVFRERLRRCSATSRHQTYSPESSHVSHIAHPADTQFQFSCHAVYLKASFYTHS